MGRDVWMRFWVLFGGGVSVPAAALVVGCSRYRAAQEVRDRGGVNPCLKPRSDRFLSWEERDVIEEGLARGRSIRRIAAQLGRAPSTVSREVRRGRAKRGLNRDGSVRFTRYCARIAQGKCEQAARRPKPDKLSTDPRLCAQVTAYLSAKTRLSPEQISAALRIDYPDDERMRISPETIYQSLYVQGRGALRRELTASLRTGRAQRRPRKRTRQRAPRVPGELLISQRPAVIEDRAVPGQWEGDLIMGKNNASAIGTLVERSTRFVMLLHFTEGPKAPQIADAIAQQITGLPKALRASLTWDQGSEMVGAHEQVTIATGIKVWFCDPASPWQRGSNENTNGLLRQYFPKGTDLSVHSRDDLDQVAAALNGRIRKTLAWLTPAQALNEVLSHHQKQPSVATTP
ncbi:MAG: IS30 family transposase [Antricoccus sp.]